jgi:hypothetical protein
MTAELATCATADLPPVPAGSISKRTLLRSGILRPATSSRSTSHAGAREHHHDGKSSGGVRPREAPTPEVRSCCNAGPHSVPGFRLSRGRGLCRNSRWVGRANSRKTARRVCPKRLR